MKCMAMFGNYALFAFKKNTHHSVPPPASAQPSSTPPSSVERSRFLAETHTIHWLNKKIEGEKRVTK